VQGTAREIAAEFELGDAKEAGLRVRRGSGQETVIQCRTGASKLFIDRAAGRVDFPPRFAEG
jgi:fructan beta-fructosidase